MVGKCLVVDAGRREIVLRGLPLSERRVVLCLKWREQSFYFCVKILEGERENSAWGLLNGHFWSKDLHCGRSFENFRFRLRNDFPFRKRVTSLGVRSSLLFPFTNPRKRTARSLSYYFQSISYYVCFIQDVSGTKAFAN